MSGSKILLGSLLTFLCSPLVGQEPAPRIYHSMVHAGADRGLYVLGGVTRHGWTMDLLDVWSLDLGAMTWDSVGPHAPGDSYSAAFDEASNRIIVFSLAGETWALDPGTSLWERMAPSESPEGRCGQRTVYDRQSDRVILFGGFACTRVRDPFQNDTWAYDYDSDAWRRMAPPESPPARVYHAMAYDPVADRTVLWGGRVADSLVWSYDHETDRWEKLEIAGGPAGMRAYHTMTHAPAIEGFVLFGGLEPDAPLSFDGSLRGDTWILSLADRTWTQVTSPESPAPRSHHAAVYHPGTGQVVIHGGELESSYSGVMSDEVWTFDPRERVWKRARLLTGPPGRQ